MWGALKRRRAAVATTYILGRAPHGAAGPGPHAAHPKSIPNHSRHHPNQCINTLDYRIYTNVEGFRKEKCSRRSCSWSAEVLGDGAPTSNLPCSEQPIWMGARSGLWWESSLSTKPSSSTDCGGRVAGAGSGDTMAAGHHGTCIWSRQNKWRDQM